MNFNFTWKEAHGSFWLASDNMKNIVRIDQNTSGPEWTVTYLEWDERLWPAVAWFKNEDGLNKAFFRKGDAWECLIGNYSSLGAAKKASVKYVKEKGFAL